MIRVLFYCPVPYALAHGGQQIQIERTMAALQEAGAETEALRWWDQTQKGDIIHYFDRMPAAQVKLAQQKGIKVVMQELLSAQGSRKPSQLRVQRFVYRAVKAIVPAGLVSRFNWESYRLADACVAGTSWEAHLMSYLFDAPPRRVHVVPNGVEDVFLNSPETPRGHWLVCAATLTERKRVWEAARAAVLAQAPLWIIGKPYSENDDYAAKFLAVAKEHSQFVRYEGAVSDRARLAQIYREARGFVLLSAMESRSLSAEEAAACGCPLLLSDLPWARSTFGKHAHYCPIASPERTAAYLRKFYDATPGLPAPPKPATWADVAAQLKTIYESVMGRGNK